MIANILLKFFRIAAFSISLVNDKAETAVPALDSLFMNSIVDIAIYKENTLKVGLVVNLPAVSNSQAFSYKHFWLPGLGNVFIASECL